MNPNDSRRFSNFQIGLIAIVLTFIGFYLAFTKSIPFAGHGYQLKAVFADAQNVRAKSPVRISGVDVGEVSDVQHVTDANGNGEDAAMVTMDIKDSALPIRQDATMQLRPRLFLEGNLFVDLHPGSPSAPELGSGSVVPENQTSSSVQFDQVLTGLQAPVRQDLQIFLKEFGGALAKYGGAEGFRESLRTSPAAYEFTSQVNQALLGTQPGDLAGFVSNLDVVARELNANSAHLQGLISNLNTVSGAFAANQASLREAIIELPQTLAVGRPALFKLNRDLPPLRAFAREALPGVRSANKALDYANPWIGQLRQLISEPGAARPRQRPAAHDPRSRGAQQWLPAVPGAGADPVLLLQQRRHSVEQHATSPTQTATPRRGRSTRRRHGDSAAWPARAARVTPTARCSASWAAAARTRLLRSTRPTWPRR